MDSVTLDTPSSPLAGLLKNAAVRQLLAMVGMAASMALGVFVIFAMQTPSYDVLWSSLNEQQVSEVARALDEEGIPYKQSGTGTIRVPAKLVDEARIVLSTNRLPSESADGLDMLKEEQSFGVSQFVQHKRYNHALETELARTIIRIDSVRNARVHLALAKDSVFVRDRGKTTASVLLDVVSGKRLGRQDVEAIVYLVSRSISGLEAEDVTVLDQTGRMLNSPDNTSDYAMSAKQFEHTRRIEDTYVQRIEDLLTPMVGHGKVRAKVDADLDFTIREQTQELFDPDNTALRSENTRFNERRGVDGAQGIPGALSNQPPVGGNQDAAGTDAEDIPPVNTSREAVRNFEVDRTISRTRQPTGEIRRLSVAVIVDNRHGTDADGSSIATPRSEAELEEIRGLVREAIGFDAERGDTITLVNSSFEKFADLAPPEDPKLWETPMFRDLLKQGIGAVLVLIVIFGLLRPMSRSLMQAAAVPQLGSPAMAALPGGASPQAMGGAVGELNAPSSIPVEQRVESARKLAGEDPQRVAQVVKNWVAEDG